MRVWMTGLLLGAMVLGGCREHGSPAGASVPQKIAPTENAKVVHQGDFIGFDRNLYPGDGRVSELKKSFAFVGFWLNNPPGETANSWAGKRGILRDAGFGFLVLANGRLDREIRKSRLSPEAFGKKDAAEAVAAAEREGFPPRTILFVDQEEGGRLLPEQAGYFFGWTETVAASGYLPGAYLSGQRDREGTTPNGKPAFITTAQDVREHVEREHRHPVTLWVYDDSCPPAPGCVLAPLRVLDSGTVDAPVWQYAQSPRRREPTQTCAKTYAADGNCYAGVSKDLFLDLDVADSPDPSHGR